MMHYREIIGAVLILGVLGLAYAIALGHVEEKTSYGFLVVVALLTSPINDFAKWLWARGGANNGNPPADKSGS